MRRTSELLNIRIFWFSSQCTELPLELDYLYGAAGKSSNENFQKNCDDGEKESQFFMQFDNFCAFQYLMCLYSKTNPPHDFEKSIIIFFIFFWGFTLFYKILGVQ